VLAGPDLQSVLVQQPFVVGTHRFVPRQFMNPELHDTVHIPFVHAGAPFAGGGAHELQPAPQKVVLLSGWQTPLQLCDPLGHMPLQADELGMHAPLQSFVVLVQAGTHCRLSQVTEPPLGTVHAEHEVGPHVAVSLLLTHLLLQTWKRLLHWGTQTPPTQAGTPLGSVGQFTHAVPHPVGSSSAAQRLPQRWVPDPHMKSQFVPSQVVAEAPVGFGQAVHNVPQLSTLVLETQTFEQLCVPLGQTPAHAAELAMQVPAHSFMLLGHMGTQAVPSQDTVPPVGCTQAEQDVVPQLPTSMLLTQRAPHR